MKSETLTRPGELSDSFINRSMVVHLNESYKVRDPEYIITNWTFVRDKLHNYLEVVNGCIPDSTPSSESIFMLYRRLMQGQLFNEMTPGKPKAERYFAAIETENYLFPVESTEDGFYLTSFDFARWRFALAAWSGDRDYQFDVMTLPEPLAFSIPGMRVEEVDLNDEDDVNSQRAIIYNLCLGAMRHQISKGSFRKSYFNTPMLHSSLCHKLDAKRFIVFDKSDIPIMYFVSERVGRNLHAISHGVINYEYAQRFSVRPRGLITAVLYQMKFHEVVATPFLLHYFKTEKI